MSDDIKRIDIKEFVDMGLLHELNRLFLHPIGLAMEVTVDDETGDYSLSGIWDYREDDEGILFGDIDREKISKGQGFIKNQHEKREKVLGYIIQEGKA